MEEVWKDIDGYDGYYQVSNMGRVRSVDRIVNGRWGDTFRKGIVLKQKTNNKGYKMVDLHKDGKPKTYQVHRLVAESFIPNPNNNPIINHKDENKLNNHVDNLEFCTQSYNINYGTRNERSAEKNTNHPSRSKPVLQFTKDGEFVAEYPSVAEAHRHTGIYQNNIYQCCIGNKLKDGRGNYYTRKSTGGFIWKYKESSLPYILF